MAAPHESLKVWQLAHQLALVIYDATAKFPETERYGLVSQLRRAAVAIPTNLAEGNARGSVRENLRFCLISRGSLAEVRYLLRLSSDLRMLPQEIFAQCIIGYDEVGKMLHFLMRSMKGKSEWNRSS